MNFKNWSTALIGGITVAIIYFTVDSCKPDSCPHYKNCESVNGFTFECKAREFQCDANPCCVDGPNPLCCGDNGVCSNNNFIFNVTNTDQCECLCDGNFTGLSN